MVGVHNDWIHIMMHMIRMERLCAFVLVGQCLVTSNILASDWNSISDIVANNVGYSISYTSTNVPLLPHRLTAICYIVDPADNNRYAVGGFDLVNGMVTKGYYNQDTSSEYGLMSGDTANTASNPNNQYYLQVHYAVFYDSDGDGGFEAPYPGYFLNDLEQLNSSQYSITNFTPYGQTPATLDFHMADPTVILPIVSFNSISDGVTNVIRLSVATVTTYEWWLYLQYKDSLTNSTWHSHSSHYIPEYGSVVSVADTNTAPCRFYRAIVPK